VAITGELRMEQWGRNEVLITGALDRLTVWSPPE
jgi:hypothetical protein